MSETRNASGDSGVIPRIIPKSPAESGSAPRPYSTAFAADLNSCSVRYRVSTRWYSGLRPGR